MIHRLVPLAMGVALLLATVGGPLTATGSVQSIPRGTCQVDRLDTTAAPPEPIGDVTDELQYTYRSYWAADPDLQPAINASFIANKTAFMHTVACLTDIARARPPTVDPWNTRAHDRFSGTGRKKTVYPAGTDLSDGNRIKDAYVQVFSITPSTQVHSSDGQQLYVADSGTVRAIVDFRFRMPPEARDDAEDRESDSFEPWVEYRGSRINTSLLVNGEVVAWDNGTKRPVLTYAGRPDASTITVRTRITATTARQFSGTTNYTHTVATTRQVAVSDPAVDAKRANFPGDEAGAYVAVDQPWQRLAFDEDGDTAVQGRWRFYTRRPADYMTVRESNGSRTYRPRGDPIVAPLQVHAVPARRGAQVNTTTTGSTSLRLTHQDGSLAKTPTLGSRVRVSMVNNTRDLDGVAVRARQDDAAAFDVVHVQGIVRGTEATAYSDSVTVDQPNVTVERVARHRDTATLSVSASADGRPVTSGSVVFENRTVPITDADGTEVTVKGQGSRAFQATYVPEQHWWNARDPLMRDSQTVVIPPATPTFRWILDLLVGAVVAFLPLVTLLVGFDYLTNGRVLGLARNQHRDEPISTNQ